MGDRIRIEGNAGAESVGLVYSGGSGETLLRVRPNSPWGFDYVFPSFDPSETVDVPRPFGPAGEYGDLAWQFPDTGDPQPLFPPANGKHVFVAAREHTMAVPAGVDRVFQCDGDDDEREINDALAVRPGRDRGALRRQLPLPRPDPHARPDHAPGPGLAPDHGRDHGKRRVGLPPHQDRGRAYQYRRVHHARRTPSSWSRGAMSASTTSAPPASTSTGTGTGLGQRDVLRLGRARR